MTKIICHYSHAVTKVVILTEAKHSIAVPRNWEQEARKGSYVMETMFQFEVMTSQVNITVLPQTDSAQGSSRARKLNGVNLGSTACLEMWRHGSSDPEGWEAARCFSSFRVKMLLKFGFRVGRPGWFHISSPIFQPKKEEENFPPLPASFQLAKQPFLLQDSPWIC